MAIPVPAAFLRTEDPQGHPGCRWEKRQVSSPRFTAHAGALCQAASASSLLCAPPAPPPWVLLTLADGPRPCSSSRVVSLSAGSVLSCRWALRVFQPPDRAMAVATLCCEQSRCLRCPESQPIPAVSLLPSLSLPDACPARGLPSSLPSWVLPSAPASSEIPAFPPSQHPRAPSGEDPGPSSPLFL